MTQHPDLFAALAAPFEPHELKERSQQGRKLLYVTARSVMNRLDNVLGPENWWDEYAMAETSVLCRLTVRLPDGQLLTKADAGGITEMTDPSDNDKSGYSDAFKRAAVKFGVARYLYRDGTPVYRREPGDDQAEPEHRQPANGQANGHTKQRHEWPGAQRSGVPATGTAAASKPRTGKALFAWLKDEEARREVSIIKWLNGWAKVQEFPGRMVEWDAVQVDQAYQVAMRKLETLEG
jgi:hypothetical protein